jgi:hypothetical protein
MTLSYFSHQSPAAFAKRAGSFSKLSSAVTPEKFSGLDEDIPKKFSDLDKDI